MDVSWNRSTQSGIWTFNVSGNQNANTVELIADGSTWKYLDDGSDLGNDWREAAFDDGAWQEGRAHLGYGDGDERTEVSSGPGPGNAATTYFRATFLVANLADVDFLDLQLVYDDAAAVYVNGVEVVRTENLAPNAAFDTYAEATRSNQIENNFVSFEIDPTVLNAGTNAIAVEVHQASANSSDVSFDLALNAVEIEIIDIEPEPELKLFPGLNRYTVQSFDGLSGTGNVVGENSIDIWFNDGTSNTVTSDIQSDTTWTAAEGPYIIGSDVAVAASATLSIEPGTTVFFAEDAALTVRGTLHAIGTAVHEIRFTRQPGASSWGGIQFRNSTTDNRIEHAILEYGVTSEGMIGLENSSLTVENSILDHTDRRRIRSVDSSLVVRNSIFTNIFDPGERPTTDNQSEHIWGGGIPEKRTMAAGKQ